MISGMQFLLIGHFVGRRCVSFILYLLVFSWQDGVLSRLELQQSIQHLPPLRHSLPSGQSPSQASLGDGQGRGDRGSDILRLVKPLQVCYSVTILKLPIKLLWTLAKLVLVVKDKMFQIQLLVSQCQIWSWNFLFWNLWQFWISHFRQVQYDASVDIYLTSKTIHDARPGVWSSPENILALYKAVEVFVGQKQNQNGKMMP